MCRRLPAPKRAALTPTVTAPLIKPTPTLRDALRAATRSRHEALDRALMPPGAEWTRDHYRRFLRGTLAALETIEPAVASILPDFTPAGEPTRAVRVRQDLRALGDGGVVAPLGVPDLPDQAAALGAAYVIEGSMLGGQHVAHALVRDLDLADGHLTYLRPPGVAIGPRWKAFVAALDAFGAAGGAAEWRAAEAAADATFAAFAEAFRREGAMR